MVPPRTTPTFTVTSRAGSVIDSSRSMTRASSRTAFAPEAWACPECASRPATRARNRADPFRRVATVRAPSAAGNPGS